MSPSAILDAIRRHRSLAQTRLQTLRLEMAVIEKEADELAIAERVVQRLTAEAGPLDQAHSHGENGGAHEHGEPHQPDAAHHHHEG
jgi:hypothetical protein